MSDIVIRAQGLGKKFIIGHKVEYSAMLGEALVRRARNVARKGLDMLRGGPVVAADEIEEFWALRDVDFQVKRGELGSIIGNNGAGKTNLLKILARILRAYTGRVALRRRVRSLA